MTQALNLTIGEISLQSPLADSEPLRRALEAALGDMARRLAARLAGQEPHLTDLRLPDLLIREDEAAAALDEDAVKRLVAVIEARVLAELTVVQ